MSDNIQLTGSSTPRVNSPNIPERQEKTRGWLAIGVFLLFALVICGVLLSAVFIDLDAGRMNFLLSVLSAVTSALGFVMGFYFGQNSRLK